MVREPMMPWAVIVRMAAVLRPIVATSAGVSPPGRV